jgi:hypothetical protein
VNLVDHATSVAFLRDRGMMNAAQPGVFGATRSARTKVENAGFDALGKSFFRGSTARGDPMTRVARLKTAARQCALPWGEDDAKVPTRPRLSAPRAMR